MREDSVEMKVHQQANAELVELLARYLRAAGVPVPADPAPVSAPNEESDLPAAVVPLG